MIIGSCHDDTCANLEYALSLAKIHVFSTARPIKQNVTTNGEIIYFQEVIHYSEYLLGVSYNGRGVDGELHRIEIFRGTWGAVPLFYCVPHLNFE